MSICSKLYSYTLNKRLTCWIENNNLLNESQAGFRKKYSTIDHHTDVVDSKAVATSERKKKRKKMYIAFINFRKPFDSVIRSKLLAVLKKKGLKGKMYQAIVSTYHLVKSKVRAGLDLTESFVCPRGLKQGEICSQVLFSLFIDDLANTIMQRGKHGIRLIPDLIEISFSCLLLMYFWFLILCVVYKVS